MARRPINYRFQQSLQRQTSVKSNEEHHEERFLGATELHVPIYLDPFSTDGVKNSKRELPFSSRNFDELHSPHTESLRAKDQLSARYTMGVERNPIGHRSVNQRSFESYDSSLSANSWASSNEPELMNDLPSNSRESHLHSLHTYKQSANYAGQSSSPILVSHQTDHPVESPDLGYRDTREYGSNRKIRIPLDGDKQQRQKEGMKSTDQSLTFHKDEHTASFKGNDKHQNVTLKIIGSERDAVSDVKFPVGGGTPNIKGLWKRAFQSLRKDKNKRESSVPKRREPANHSDEIDPVYHLLRCAASKSQSTAIATSGIGTPKPMDKLKPNTMDSPKSSRSTGSGLESTVKLSSHTGSGSTTRKLTNVTFRPFGPDPVQSNTEARSRRDSRYLLEDMHSNAANLGHSPSRGLNPKLHPDLGGKDTSHILEIGDGILEGNTETEKSKEAQLAYEQHKRLNARRTMLKNTQKSLSFAVDDDHGSESNLKSKSTQVYNQRLRPPTLCERMKSLSVDDKHEMDQRKQWKDNVIQHIPRSAQSHTGSQVLHKDRSGYDRVIEGNLSEHGAYKPANKVTLLSTKSFSLDVPGSEKSDESDRVISGASSPGQHITKFGQEYQQHHQQQLTRKGFHCPTRTTLLSPLSASKLETQSTAHYRTPEWHTGIQSQPNLDEQKPRYSYQPYPSSSTINHPIGSKFTTGALSSGNIYHGNDSYNRREQSNMENVYFVINDFVPRRRDDLPIRIGQLVRVIENSDKLWWYGSCDGQVGYFPSTFVHRLRPT